MVIVAIVDVGSNVMENGLLLEEEEDVAVVEDDEMDEMDESLEVGLVGK